MTERIERYVDARELASLMGVSTATVKRWVRAGVPSETWGMRTRRFRLSEVIQWARTQGDTVTRDERTRAGTQPRRRAPIEGDKFDG